MWQFLGYRKALFWYDLVWQDCEKLKRDLRGRAVAQQLIRSAGSISANVEGGHGRRAIAFILISCPFVILSDRRERRISISPRKEEILRRFAPQNDSLERLKI